MSQEQQIIISLNTTHPRSLYKMLPHTSLKKVSVLTRRPVPVFYMQDILEKLSRDLLVKQNYLLIGLSEEEEFESVIAQKMQSLGL